MSLVRGILIIVGCGACFGVAGGLLGLTLAVGAPAYYRGVFRAADDPRFNPVQVGLGLGISQGLICGTVVGAVLVLAVALSRSSPQKGEAADLPDDDFEPDRRRSSRTRRFLTLIAGLAAMACGAIIGFVAGAIVGESQLYQKETEAKLARIRPVLREPPFVGINAEYSSDAQVFLIGTVGSAQALKDLEERMRFLFGDQPARFMTASVEVAKK
jgi:hypothetical protein